MAIPKYKKQYLEMLEKNKELFDAIKTTKRNSPEFKELQNAALRIIGKNENMLCKRTENTKFANFSSGLADKFLEAVRSDYPEIYST